MIIDKDKNNNSWYEDEVIIKILEYKNHRQALYY